MMTSSTDSSTVDMSDWESVTVDLHQWTVLVKQLEDLLALQCLLKMRPASEGLVSKPVWEPEPITVHVKRVLDGGRGTSLDSCHRKAGSRIRQYGQMTS